MLPSVREAEARIVSEQLDKEYAGIVGLRDFNDAAIKYEKLGVPLWRDLAG